MRLQFFSKLGLLGLLGLATQVSTAEVTTEGLSPPANTYGSFLNESIARDSGLNRPLDLLNDFYPSVEVVYSRHDNVRRRPDFDEPDWKLTVAPTLAYRTNLGRHQFYAAYNGTYTFHKDIDQEDAQANSINAQLGLDLSRHWDIDLFGSLGESFEERGVSGGRQFDAFVNQGINSGPEEVDYRNYGIDLVYGRKIDILKVVLGLERNDSGFKNDNLLTRVNTASSRDRTRDSIHLDVDWRFSPKTSVFGRIQRSDIDYDQTDVNLDSEQQDILVGLRMKATSSLSGVVGVGKSEKTFDDVEREKFDSSIYYANLTYAFNPFSSLQLAASRTVEEPGDEVSDFYESEYISLGLNHAFSPRWLFNAYAKSVDDDFNTGREDKYFDWGASIDYVWRDWLTVGAFYGEIDRESNLDDISYDDRFFGLRLRSDLRSVFGSRNRERDMERFLNTRKTQKTGKVSEE